MNENLFNLNQNDLTLDDSKVLWTGGTVQLFDVTMKKLLASFTADKHIVAKIQRWCIKNHYRCSQVHDGRVWL